MNGNELTYQKDANAPVVIECPKCKTGLKNSIGYLAINVVCPSCGTIFHYRSKTILGEVRTKVTSLIPLGTKGNFRGEVYEVVGFIQYREHRTIYLWNEYTLFNPKTGYLFLSEYNGHWMFTMQTCIFPLSHQRTFVLFEQTFDLFNDYKASIEFAAGIFNWNILDSEKISITEYLSPPYMLIKEKSANELSWYKGEYVEAIEITRAFQGSKGTLPRKYGNSPLQPSKVSETLPYVMKFSILAMIVLCVLQLVFVNTAVEKEVFRGNYSLDSLKPIVTPPFKLDSRVLGQDNLEFDLYSPVDNDWMEAAITLINDNTGEEYYFEQGVEYYHGYDDGPWSEGNIRTSKVLSSIPDGTYHLIIVPAREPLSPSRASFFEISVTRGVAVWSNFFLVLVCMIIYPGIQYIRNEYIEYQRWFGS